MRPLMSAQYKYIQEKFPNAAILSTIGNNDVIYYYEAPYNQETKALFYGDLYELQFSGQDAPAKNKQYGKLGDIELTMSSGGYYRYDTTEKLSVLSLNTIYYHRVNMQDLQTGEEQLKWLEDQLAQAPAGHKFILMMHIFPGLFYLDKMESFWKSADLLTFSRILSEHSDKILLTTGAHIHFGDIRAPMMHPFGIPDPKSVFLICPSISPIFKNNPAYSILDVDAITPKITDLTWRFLNLDSFIFNNRQVDMSTVKPQQEFNIDLNDYRTVRRMDDILKIDD